MMLQNIFKDILGGIFIISNKSLHIGDIVEVNFYSNDSLSDPRLKSEMRYEIDAKFRENSISIPFPQTDLHIFQSGPFDHRNAVAKTDMK